VAKGIGIRQPQLRDRHFARGIAGDVARRQIQIRLEVSHHGHEVATAVCGPPLSAVGAGHIDLDLAEIRRDTDDPYRVMTAASS
jgi:hypothetical protein